jgi:hypothetical protein
MVLPAQYGPVFDEVAVGTGLTVTTAFALAEQPDVVPVTVYVVVTVGFAITLVPVVALNPVEGLHA